MQRIKAAARHIWARQHAWLLLSFFPFPVSHPMSAGCTHTACSLLAAHLHTISRPRPRGVSRPRHLPQQHGRPVLLPRHAFSPPTYALITPAPVVVEIHVSFVRSFPPLSLLSFFHISTFAVSLIRQFVASPQEPRPEQAGVHLLVGRGAAGKWRVEM